MGSRITHQRVVGREALLALLVLALVFLNFGHANFAFAHDGQIVSGPSVYCGNPLSPGDGDHLPCHACRTGQAASLPPVPCTAEAVFFVAMPVVYADELVPSLVPIEAVPGQPRAPPFAV